MMGSLKTGSYQSSSVFRADAQLLVAIAKFKARGAILSLHHWHETNSAFGLCIIVTALVILCLRLECFTFSLESHDSLDLIVENKDQGTSPRGAEQGYLAKPRA